MESLYSLYDALVSIDVAPDRARSVVSALEKDMIDTLASKADIQRLEADIARLGGDIERLRTDVGDSRSEFKDGLAALRTELKEDIAALRTELKEDMAALRNEWKQECVLLRSSMTVRFGAMQAAGLMLLFAALRLT